MSTVGMNLIIWDEDRCMVNGDDYDVGDTNNSNGPSNEMTLMMTICDKDWLAVLVFKCLTGTC